MNSSPNANILVAAVLFKGAHDVRNKLSAIVGALDLLNASPQSDEFSESAVEILREGEAGLRELAASWTEDADELFAVSQVELDPIEVIEPLAAGFGVPVEGERGAVNVRCDQRILEMLIARLLGSGDATEVSVSRDERYGLHWLVIAIKGRGCLGRQGGRPHIAALLKQLGANKSPGSEDNFVIRLRIEAP